MPKSRLRNAANECPGLLIADLAAMMIESNRADALPPREERFPMTGFLKQSSCKGHRPNHLASRRHYPRPDLIARLLRERHVARFLVAPEGFGKTGLTMEYAHR